MLKYSSISPKYLIKVSDFSRNNTVFTNKYIKQIIKDYQFDIIMSKCVIVK